MSWRTLSDPTPASITSSRSAGSLAVRGDPLAGLEWTRRAMDLTEGVREELERTRSLPEVRTVTRALSGHPDSSRHPDLSGHPDERRRVPAP